MPIRRRSNGQFAPNLFGRSRAPKTGVVTPAGIMSDKETEEFRVAMVGIAHQYGISTENQTFFPVTRNKSQHRGVFEGEVQGYGRRFQVKAFPNPLGPYGNGPDFYCELWTTGRNSTQVRFDDPIFEDIRRRTAAKKQQRR